MTATNLPEKIQNFVIFKTADGKVNIDVYFHNETLWLSQKLIAELFQKDRSVVSKHLKNIFEEGELDEHVVCAKFALTTQHGARWAGNSHGHVGAKFIAPYNAVAPQDAFAPNTTGITNNAVHHIALVYNHAITQTNAA